MSVQCVGLPDSGG